MAAACSSSPRVVAAQEEGARDAGADAVGLGLEAPGEAVGRDARAAFCCFLAGLPLCADGDESLCYSPTRFDAISRGTVTITRQSVVPAGCAGAARVASGPCAWAACVALLPTSVSRSGGLLTKDRSTAGDIYDVERSSETGHLKVGRAL